MDPFDDILIPPDYLQGLDDDDGCLHGAAAIMGAEAEDERRLSEAQVGDHSPIMQQPSTSPSCTVAGEGAGGDGDPFDDIVIPPDYLQELLDDDDNGSLDGEEAEAEDERRRRLAEAQAGGDGLSMTYRGHTHVFDSVPSHKVIMARWWAIVLASWESKRFCDSQDAWLSFFFLLFLFLRKEVL
jgi:hypothetical protein